MKVTLTKLQKCNQLMINVIWYDTILEWNGLSYIKKFTLNYIEKISSYKWLFIQIYIQFIYSARKILWMNKQIHKEFKKTNGLVIPEYISIIKKIIMAFSIRGWGATFFWKKIEYLTWGVRYSECYNSCSNIEMSGKY